MFDNLPPELLILILIKLPVRTLLILKSVSKSFLSIINNPTFPSLHFNQFNTFNSNTPLLLLLKPPSFDCRFVAHFNNTEMGISQFENDNYSPLYGLGCDLSDADVGGYVNGLLLLYRVCEKNSKYESQELILWNPSIRKSIRVPPPPVLPSFDWYNMGFGYDPVSDDYKAVGIFIERRFRGFSGFGPRPQTNVEVYSVKNRSWRSVGVDVIDYDWDLRQCVHVGGVVHWIGVTVGNVGEDSFHPSHIVSFDLGSECFRFTLLPSDEGEDEVETEGELSWGRVRLPVLYEGLLAVLCISFGHIRVWVMREDGWTKECTFQSSSLLCHYLINVVGMIQKVLFSKENDELLFTVLVDGMVSYNIKSMVLKNFGNRVTYVDTYVDSLFWI